MGAQDWGVQVNYDEEVSDRISHSDGCYTFVHKQDPNIVYTALQGGQILKYVDAAKPGFRNGNMHRILNNMDANDDVLPDEGHPLFITKYAVSEFDSDVLFFPTNENIWRSTDAGGSWVRFLNLEGRRVADIVCDDGADPTLFISYWIPNGANGLLKVDGAKSLASGSASSFEIITGDEWTYLNNLTLDPSNPDHLYGTDIRGNLFRIETGPLETTVGQINGDLPDLIYRALSVQPDEAGQVIFAGSDLGLFSSTNGGKNWILHDELPFTRVTDLRYRQTDRRLFIFTYGRGTFSATVEQNFTSTTALSFPDFHVAPNPFIGEIRVVRASRGTGHVRIRDLVGRIIINQQLELNETVLDLSSIGPGTYICEVEANHRTSLRKIIKI